jgi:uncharacterized protein YbjQ (UPF0145 family)
MRITPSSTIEGRRIVYAIGKIKASSAWHAANRAPLQDNLREAILDELVQKAEDLDADAIIGLDYETSDVIRDSETGLQLKRVAATGIAVKLSCAA